jgi:hypothetical protein
MDDPEYVEVCLGCWRPAPDHSSGASRLLDIRGAGVESGSISQERSSQYSN